MKYFGLLFFALFLSKLSLAEKFPATTLTNQWDKPAVINNTTQLVLFAADMDASDIIKASLDELQIVNLAERNWVYVANIAKIPSLVAKLFALPEMRDYPFPMALDKEGKSTGNWIRKENQVTVFKLNELTIEDVKFFADTEGFKHFLLQQTALPIETMESVQPMTESVAQ